MVEPGADTETDMVLISYIENREHHAQRITLSKATKGRESNLSGAVLDDILWR
jgi:hypothetical protein